MCLSCYHFFFYGYGDHRDLHSFPTRRSSDLVGARLDVEPALQAAALVERQHQRRFVVDDPAARHLQDRKSTRLNSSHSSISYAVFCLKKKNAKIFNSVTIITCS